MALPLAGLQQPPGAHVDAPGLALRGRDRDRLVEPCELAGTGLEPHGGAEEITRRIDLLAARELGHHVGRAMAVALTDDLHHTAALVPDRIARVELERAVAAQD